MTSFSDERPSDLRELYLESSLELLQELNDAGILLEANPGDASAFARVRRAMHTLKGDSATCGFKALSELAHNLEDLFTPELIAKRGSSVAEIILSAADTFHAMLAAFRDNLQLPDISGLRSHIKKLMDGSDFSSAVNVSPAHAQWSPQERGRMMEAVRRGDTILHLLLRMYPALDMPAAAFQLVNHAVGQCGVILASRPESGVSLPSFPQFEAVIASSHDPDWIQRRCSIPGIVDEVVFRSAAELIAETDDPLQEIFEAEAKSKAAIPSGQVHGATDSVADGSAPQAASGLTSAESWLRVEPARVDAVMNLVGELIIGKSMLHRAFTDFERRFPKDPLRNRLADALSFQSIVLNELQKSVMKIRMVPVEHLFRRLPRIVRDVAKSGEKQITVEMGEQNPDLDKSVLDALAEPLAHLVRNAADHGIETPEERLRCGKPALGTISLDGFYQGNQVVIEIRDDGQGINRERLVSRAIDLELLTEEEARRLSDAEKLQLIFRPGLSTAKEVTNTSGRGVGMDVVAEAVNRLKGKIVVQSEPGRGTTFQILVPLTLASIQALTFRVGTRHYAVPLDAVLELARAHEGLIHEIDGAEVIRLRDRVMSVVRLEDLFDHAPGPQLHNARHYVIIVGSGDKRFAMVVDNLVGEEELVIKALEDRLVASELVSGASILGDGSVVLILNVAAVVVHLGRRRAGRISA